MKVAVLVIDWHDNVSKSQFESMSDKDLSELVDGDGMLFTLEAFQEAINEDFLDLGNCYIKFIK